MLEDLKGKGHNVVAKTKIEPQTLKSFVKEEINKGNSVPMELFGVYVHNETKIKTTYEKMRFHIVKNKT